MKFDDDEPITAFQDQKATPLFAEGKTKTKIIHKPDALLEAGEFKVLLELQGAGLGKDRSGLDLVIIVDVSASMGGQKLQKMKTAVQFVIKKLSPIDRLSVVAFSGESERLFPLRQINESSQEEIADVVNSLVPGSGTDITVGLEMGLKVLKDRSFAYGRVAGVMLMSDGYGDGDASLVQIGDVPVYTFGFGSDHDPMVLKAVADASNGGVYSDVRNTEELVVAFSQCLAGLVTVVVQDLRLTITPLESTIEVVLAGNYPQTLDSATGSVTVSFGDLYDKELRKIIVNLLLPAAFVTSSQIEEVLRFTYSYRYVCMRNDGRKKFDGNPQIVSVTRTRRPESEMEEIITEEKRIEIVEMMKDARLCADENKLDVAKEMLEKAAKEADVSGTELLKSEVQCLLQSMDSHGMYKRQGRPFALSFESSHEHQRFAARGNMGMLRLFATPRMDAYLEQAKLFGVDPEKKVLVSVVDADVDVDVNRELEANPLSSIARMDAYLEQAKLFGVDPEKKVLVSDVDADVDVDVNRELEVNPLSSIARWLELLGTIFSRPFSLWTHLTMHLTKFVE